MEEIPLIGLILAMPLEAGPFIEALGLEATGEACLPVYKGDGIVLVISGIGKTNAAIATTYCCTAFHPQWIVNLGAAGSTKASHRLGDVFHVTKVVEWDRPLPSSQTPHVHSPQVLRDEDLPHVLRGHPPHVLREEHFPHVLPGFREAVLATQDKPVIDRRHRLAIEPHADLVDMEGAAVVQAAQKLATPCVLFKFVSDTPDHESKADIIAHIRDFGAAFCRFVADSVIPVLR